MIFNKMFFVFNFVISFLFFAAILIMPMPLDMLFVSDTALLGHLGWRGVNGFEPVIDFPHFYGGMTAQYVTFAFQLFGVSYKSIHYAFAMMFVTVAVVLLALSWKRLAGSGTALLMALSAALMLSLLPIEFSSQYDRVHRSVTHAWSYNHAGIALMMALTVFALRSADSRIIEMAAALAAGVALGGLILLKTIFGVMLPCVVLACMLQARWLSAMLVVVATAATMQALDPGLVRSLGSLEFLLNSEAAERAGGLSGRIKYAFEMLLAQAALVAVNVVLAAMVLRSEGRDALHFLGSTLICASGYGVAMLATGGLPNLLLLPFLVVFSLMAADRLAASQHSFGRLGSSAVTSPDIALAWAIPACMAYALIVPALLAVGYTGVRSLQYSNATLVAEGPFSDYFAFGAITRIPGMNAPDAAARRAAAIEELSSLLSEGQNINRYDSASADYAVYADGIVLLQQIPDVVSFGIISGTEFDFTMPLGSKVVPSHPVWPTPNMRGRDRIGTDVDLIMIPTIDRQDRQDWGLLSAELQTMMGGDFRLCRRSTFWDLYAHKSLPAAACDTALVPTSSDPPD